MKIERAKTREDLEAYGRRLVSEAGFKVWLSPYGKVGYLTYQDPESGCWGTLQQDANGVWEHLMPIVPSTEHGSHMVVEDDDDPWTVVAARKCARTSNSNRVIGWKRNRGSAYLSPTAIALHDAQVGRAEVEGVTVTVTVAAGPDSMNDNGVVVFVDTDGLAKDRPFRIRLNDEIIWNGNPDGSA